ncbi:hypothetical protein MKQ70_16165 [Chitinophaga sedimenti]|uniref:hypothetical protein n=1 Tax=Chitinophaga sedimenti TaxID=2033606 RepID=UPI0020035984|nr:hypothetical protein [Chitinophaga sedimenti]MCK7556466.1 hypothetical protein [Chitinophaga sedimenti]
MTPDNVATIDYAFRNRNEAENYLFTCYSTLQSMSSMTTNPAFTTSGEIFFLRTCRSPRWAVKRPKPVFTSYRAGRPWITR